MAYYSLLPDGVSSSHAGSSYSFQIKQHSKAVGMNQHDKNHSTREHELLNVMTALHGWRCNLEGAQKVTILTDHISNTFLDRKHLHPLLLTSPPSLLLFLSIYQNATLQALADIPNPLPPSPNFPFVSCVPILTCLVPWPLLNAPDFILFIYLFISV